MAQRKSDLAVLHDDVHHVALLIALIVLDNVGVVQAVQHLDLVLGLHTIAALWQLISCRTKSASLSAVARTAGIVPKVTLAILMAPLIAIPNMMNNKCSSYSFCESGATTDHALPDMRQSENSISSGN